MSVIILGVLLVVAVAVMTVLGKQSFNKEEEIGKLKRIIRQIRRQSHNSELDLSLATVEQIVAEMNTRPNLRFILLLPEPGSVIQLHIHNVSADIAVEVLRKGVDIMQKTCDPD